MTSEQIQSATEDSKNPAGWLKEIAYQLAKLNEQMIQEPQQQAADNQYARLSQQIANQPTKSPSKKSHK